MITWICNRLTVGVVCLILAGCARPIPEDSTVNNPADDALSSATLADGSIALVPPSGYCIDPESLTDNFALMARCDRLGGPPEFGAPVAVITAATAGSVPALGFGRVFGTERETIIARREAEGVTLLQVKGTPPIPTMRDVFWRGISKIEGKMLGLAIYESKDSAPLGEQAPDLLAQTLRRTKARTEP